MECGTKTLLGSRSFCFRKKDNEPQQCNSSHDHKILCKTLIINICIHVQNTHNIYQHQVDNSMERHQIMFFFILRMALFWAFKAHCAHKPSDSTCVYDKYSEKNIEEGFAKNWDLHFQNENKSKTQSHEVLFKAFCVLEMRRASKKPPTF